MTADPEVAYDQFSKPLLVASALAERHYSDQKLCRQLEIPA
jgi:hypothetical protein